MWEDPAGPRLSFDDAMEGDAASSPMNKKIVIFYLDITPKNIFMSRSDASERYLRMVFGDFACAVTRRDVKSGRESATEHRHGTRDWMLPHSIRLRWNTVSWRVRGI